MAAASKPFQLLEINIISAQDLEPVSKKMKTYATAWMNLNRKLSSSVDSEGNNNPTWNDKFVFRVDEEFLKRDTSAVMIQIHSQHWFRDVLVGTVRVLVGNLIPPAQNQRNHYMGMRFVALQVRRPSGRPQGILNIGVALLDNCMRSMPLYTQLSMSAVGYRDLNDDPPNLTAETTKQNDTFNDKDSSVYGSTVKPIITLRRTRSERSSTLGFESYNPQNSILAPRAETVVVPKDGNTPTHTNSILAPKADTILAPESSILSISDYVDPFKMKKMGKASSVISGAELRERPRPYNAKKGKASSVLSDSILSKESSSVFLKTETTSCSSDSHIDKNTGRDDLVFPRINRSGYNEKPKIDPIKSNTPSTTIGKPVPTYQSSSGFAFGAPPPPPPPKGVLTPQGKFVMGAPVKKGNSIWSDSEVGPSPSEVAAVMMAERKYPLEQQDNQSSVLDGWSLDESVEGLRSKLERWRTEVPPLYDRGGFSTSSYKSSATNITNHRSKNNGGNGLFSCFGNIFGYECQCICGKPPGKKRRAGKFQSPSTITPGRSFI